MYFAQTPAIAKFLFKKIIWNIPSKEKTIYLTFDDGPTPEITDQTIEILRKFNAKATFFCIGKNIENHADVFQKILSEKHSIGNHSYSHLNGWESSSQIFLDDVLKCQQIILEQLAIYAKNNSAKGVLIPERRKSKKFLFRPPYGKITPTQYSILNAQYSIIMWNVLSGDFDSKITGEKCFNNVAKNSKNGSIVVFHDSEKASKKLFYSLPKTLDYFSEKGFRFETIQND